MISLGITLNLLCSVSAVQMDQEIPAQMSHFMPMEDLLQYRQNVVSDFNEMTPKNIEALIHRTDVAALREEVIAMKPGRKIPNVCESNKFERVQRFLFELFHSVDHDFHQAWFTHKPTAPTGWANDHSVKHHLDCINHAIAFVNIFNGKQSLLRPLLQNDDYWFAFIIMVGLHSIGRVAEWDYTMDPYYYARTTRITQFVLTHLFNELGKEFSGDNHVLQFIAAQRSYMIFSFDTSKEQFLLTTAKNQHDNPKYSKKWNQDTPKLVHGSKQSEIITQEQVDIIAADTRNFANFMESENKEFFTTLKLLFYNIHMWDLHRIPSWYTGRIIEENRKYHEEDFAKLGYDYGSIMDKVSIRYNNINRCNGDELIARMEDYEIKRNEKIHLCEQVLEKLKEIQQDEIESAKNRNVIDSSWFGQSAWPAKLAAMLEGARRNTAHKTKKENLKTLLSLFRSRHFDGKEVPQAMNALVLEEAIKRVQHDLQKKYSF